MTALDDDRATELRELRGATFTREQHATGALTAVTDGPRNRMSCIVVEQCDLATLQVGDHLTVMRRRFAVLPYAHHGIYEGDGDVIDFGSGSWDGATRKTLAGFGARVRP